MALMATSLRAALSDLSRSFQYSLLLFLAALFALVGGYFLGGIAIMSYDLTVPAIVAGLLIVLLFSYIFVWYASDLSSFLGHKTYLSREDFATRGFRVFILWIAVYLLVYFLYNFVPYPFDALLTFAISLVVVYASVVVAIDGYSIAGGVRAALYLMRDQWTHVGEFILLSTILALMAFLLDFLGGILGFVLSVTFVTFVVIPWITAHVVLTYLYRYPIVVAGLRKLERF